MIFDSGYYSDAGWSKETMSIVLNQETQEEWANVAFEKFKARFDPVQLFENAGVWAALERFYAHTAGLPPCSLDLDTNCKGKRLKQPVW